jgi:beta-glucanase (GH16 family)
MNFNFKQKNTSVLTKQNDKKTSHKKQLSKSRLGTHLISALLLSAFSSMSQAGWEVQWIDKFEGTGVNWDNWTAQTEANYNNEVQCYTDDDSSSEKNYDVSDGTLKIIARKGSNYCTSLNTQKSWTSGRLNSKDKQEFLYGRIESRIRFLNLERGTWPAFWMLENRINQQPVKGDGDTSYWPNEGASEIDVWEWFSNDPDSYITNFFTGESNCGGLEYYQYPNGSIDVTEWHKYAIEWDEDQIDFYVVDDSNKQTLVVSQDMRNCDRYEEDMFVLLNVAMGGSLGGSIDSSLEMATMEVDYVAHCTANTASSSTFCDEGTQVASDSNNSTDTDSNEINYSGNTSGSGGSMNSFILLVLGLLGFVKYQNRQSNRSRKNKH